MKMQQKCYACLFQQVVNAAWLLTEIPEQREAMIRGAGKFMAETDFDRTPPELGGEIHAMIRHILQNPDPYREIKREMNSLTKRFVPELIAQIQSSSNPLETAIRYAIAGNIIDFSTFQNISDEEIRKTAEKAASKPIIGLNVSELQTKLQTKSQNDDGKSLLYVCDNCGEIVWDAFLIREFQRLGLHVTAAVRGGATVNDATLEDAKFAGLFDLCDVITTGADVPGAPNAKVSEEFRRFFLNSDFVVAKGQGNLETMQPAARKVLHLFMVKCSVIEKMVHLPKGTLAALELGGISN